MYELAMSYITLTDAMCSSSFLRQPCSKSHPVVVEKIFEKGQIIGNLQAEKKSKEIR